MNYTFQLVTDVETNLHEWIALASGSAHLPEVHYPGGMSNEGSGPDKLRRFGLLREGNMEGKAA